MAKAIAISRGVSPLTNPGHRVLASVGTRIREPLHANALYLFLGQVASAGLGFLFWTLAARSLPPSDVGIAVAAIAAINLLVVLSDLGLGTAIIGLSAASTGHQGSKVVNASVAIRWISATVAGTVFLVGAMVWAPGLLTIRTEPVMVLVFVAFTVFHGMLALHGAAMLSRRRGAFLFWRFFACGLLSIPLIVVLPLLVPQRWVVLWAYNLPVVLFTLLSATLVLPRFFNGYRILGRFDLPETRRLVDYAPVNHVANLLWIAPLYVLPILAANAMSYEAAAYFYMPWMMGNLLLSMVRSASVSLFAEGSAARHSVERLARETLFFALALALPAGGILWFVGNHFLGLFGKGYMNVTLLRLILMSLLPFAINSVVFVVLRVKRRWKSLLSFSFLIALLSIGLAYVWASAFGIVGLGLGWLVGQSVATLLTLALAPYHYWKERSQRSWSAC